MPVKKAAWKDLRQAKKRAARNRNAKIILRKTLKTANKAIAAKQTRNDAWKSVYSSIKKLDRAAQKKLIKKNTASRKKSRLMKQLNKLEKTPARTPQ